MSWLVKLWRLSVIVFYACVMLYVTYGGFTNPNRNWDMICYVGSVTAWTEKTPEAIYAGAMGELKKSVPDWMYQQFIENPLSATPAAYVQQIPFCQVKPLYNASLWLLRLISGMPLTIGSWVTSAIGFFALAVVLFLWRPRYLPRSAWLLLVVGLTLLGEEPMSELAHLSTPDMLSTVLVVSALYAWLTRHSYWTFCPLGLLAMLARPDAIIPVGAFTVYISTFAPKEHRLSLFKGGAFIATLLVVTTVVKHIAQPANYTYGMFFIYSFLNKNPNPATMDGHLTWDMYWPLFTVCVGEFLTVPRIMVLLAMTALACLCYYMKPARGNRLWFDMLLLTWGSLSVRFILWPASHEYRFYYGYCLIILMACGELISAYAGTLWNLLQEHRRRISAAEGVQP